MIEKASEDPNILTLGQASCLVLGLPPTIENRKRSKEIIEETKIIEVSYKRRGDPLEPFLIGKKVKFVNPFLYKSYDATPPPSPKVSSDDYISIASTGSNEDEELSLINQKEETKEKEPSDKIDLPEKTKDSYSSDDTYEPQDKEIVIRLLAKVLTRERPSQVHKYKFTWIDEIAQLEIVKSHFYMESLTAERLETWIAESGIFGDRFKRTFNQNVQFGRYLYLLKEKYRSEKTIF